MNYVLKLVETESGTGYFEVVPRDDIDLKSAFKILNNRYYDDFLHRYVLTLLKDFNDAQISALIKKAKDKNDFIIQAIACERILLSGSLAKVKKFFSEKQLKNLQKFSPLINIRSALGNNKRLHDKWIALFKDNIIFHKDLPSYENTGLPLICAGECSLNKKLGPSIKDLYNDHEAHLMTIKNSLTKSEILTNYETPYFKGTLSVFHIKNYAGDHGKIKKFSEKQTIQTALERLENAGIVLKEEMRHESSLSPFALLRKWQFHTRVENNRNIFSLSGEQTSYGKGITIESARASLTMEIVERCSAFASISSLKARGFIREYPLLYGSYKELAARGKLVLNPDKLALEIKYDNEPLYWIQGTMADHYADYDVDYDTGHINGENTDQNINQDIYQIKYKDIFIPAQAVFLFSNLDEIDLFSGLGSTGLASGNTMEQAKVSALLEIIERHQEAVVPFETSQCFRLVVEDKEKNKNLAKLLESYYSLGIDLQFQDITPEYGVPCCKCFVKGTDGKIYKGSAAGLNAQKAIISAITETPYPFPHGPSSEKGPDNLIIVGFENLPDYSTSYHASDLALLEHVLISNGLKPYYVDLTRKDIGLPVVKAIIPGMEIIGDFDEFSRVHPELFQNYLKVC